MPCMNRREKLRRCPWFAEGESHVSRGHVRTAVGVNWKLLMLLLFGGFLGHEGARRVCLQPQKKINRKGGDVRTVRHRQSCKEAANSSFGPGDLAPRERWTCGLRYREFGPARAKYLRPGVAADVVWSTTAVVTIFDGPKPQSEPRTEVLQA